MSSAKNSSFITGLFKYIKPLYSHQNMCLVMTTMKYAGHFLLKSHILHHRKPDWLLYSYIHIHRKSENLPPVLWMSDVHIVMIPTPTPWLGPIQKKFFASIVFWYLFLVTLPRTLGHKVIIFRNRKIFRM